MDRPSSSSASPPFVIPNEALEQFFQEDVPYLWMMNSSTANDANGNSNGNAASSSTTEYNIPIYEDGPPSALHFLRQHVAVSRPCIIRNAIRVDGDDDDDDDHDHPPSSTERQPLLLTLDDLLQRHAEMELVVDVTPDGHGDCLRRVVVDENDNQYEDDDDDQVDNNSKPRQCFVKPHEQTMTLATFVNALRQGRHKQQQEQEQQQSSSTTTAIPQRTFHRDTPDEANNNDKIDLTDCVLYYSRQNDCLRQELQSLWTQQPDPQQQQQEEPLSSTTFPRSFDWADAAFGTNGPDAVNLWMGDERAVSSMHKDHYENLFYVLDGVKTFTLLPPASAPLLYERPIPSGQFVYTTTATGGSADCRSSDKEEDSKTTTTRKQPDNDPQYEWKVRMDQSDNDNNNTNIYDNPSTTTTPSLSAAPQQVPWIAADILHPDLDQYPLLKYAPRPLQVTVRAGDMMYLPALWFHRVSQQGETVAVNWWYDMRFDSPHWCYFHLLQQMRPREEL